MKLAQVASERGTCMKKKVGAVAIDENDNILAITYNGTARGQKHCDADNPCPALLDTRLSCEANHAEANLLMRCNTENIKAIYITEAPCRKCRLMIANTSCKHTIYPVDGKLIITDSKDLN
jgi:dCMP deaminase